MTSQNLGPPILNNIQNGVLRTTRAMPQKDINSMCDADFSLERLKYTESSLNPAKKWFGNRDASVTTSRRKTAALGSGSIRVAPLSQRLGTHNNINVVNDALTRVRAGGCVPCAKARNRPKNAPTPSWPAGPLVRSAGGVGINQCYTTQPKKVNSMNPAWSTSPNLRLDFQNGKEPVLGDPTDGQYTTMRSKGLPRGVAPSAKITDTGLYNRFRKLSAPNVTVLPPLYH
jgi:hypothetical protein